MSCRHNVLSSALSVSLEMYFPGKLYTFSQTTYSQTTLLRVGVGTNETLLVLLRVSELRNHAEAVIIPNIKVKHLLIIALNV